MATYARGVLKAQGLQFSLLTLDFRGSVQLDGSRVLFERLNKHGRQPGYYWVGESILKRTDKVGQGWDANNSGS